jgi:hypothetical protein
MREDGADIGEKCGLCGTVMNEGARVCTGCHASRRIVTGGTVGCLSLPFVIVRALFGIKEKGAKRVVYVKYD